MKNSQVSVESEISQKVISQNTSLDGKPLDFSYKNINELKGKFKVEPRSGNRRPLIIQHKASNDQNQQQESTENASTVSNKEHEQDLIETMQLQEDGEKKEDEKKKEIEIIRILPQSTIKNIIKATTTSLNSDKQKSNNLNILQDQQKIGNKVEKNIVQVNLITSQLNISYNNLKCLVSFKETLDQVMYKSSNLRWIDLSHNLIEIIDYDFNDFENLQILQLHCNQIKELKEIEKLSTNKNLKNFTIHGNPLENIPNFRIYIIGILPQLKKLDTVLISLKEKDNANFFMKDLAQKKKKNKFPQLKN